MPRRINPNTRHIQIAFNHSAQDVRRIIPQIPSDGRVIIEAGTPYIKKEGIAGIRLIRRLWNGIVVADLKVSDGAFNEVLFAYNAGADAITAAGNAPDETLDVFIETCNRFKVTSMIDMLGQENPLKKLMRLKKRPDVVVIHKGRDEEANPRSIIRYKDINKVRSKFGILISVAGGLNQENVRKAYFNGADIAVLNIVKSNDVNEGILDGSNLRILVPYILKDVGF